MLRVVTFIDWTAIVKLVVGVSVIVGLCKLTIAK